MKKGMMPVAGIWKPLGLLLLLPCIAGCSDKACRCYILERWGSVNITTTYTTGRHQCGELGYDIMNPRDSSYRFCTDIEDEVISSDSIARMFRD